MFVYVFVYDNNSREIHLPNQIDWLLAQKTRCYPPKAPYSKSPFE